MRYLPSCLIQEWYWPCATFVINAFTWKLGRFIFSALKRNFEIKDCIFLRGHGGILDRLDSILACFSCFFINRLYS